MTVKISRAAARDPIRYREAKARALRLRVPLEITDNRPDRRKPPTVGEQFTTRTGSGVVRTVTWTNGWYVRWRDTFGNGQCTYKSLREWGRRL